MAKELFKGNEALAEAAIRAGCRMYAGYPITPQSEMVEYLSWRMPEVGGVFVQAESELSGVSMVYGAAATGFRALISSSGPGFDLLQEGITYMAAAELPCVVVDVARYGFGLGHISGAQGDYFQVVKGGGHGDYRTLVYAPATIQETADLTSLAFDKAEEYRNPVLILSDGAMGQMMEAVEFPPMKTHDPNKFDWAMTGNSTGKHKRITNRTYYEYEGAIPQYEEYLRNKYDTMRAKEQRWEAVGVEDADVVLVSYGISSRICKEALGMARTAGLKLGLLRPITLFPFPVKAFEQIPASVKGFLAVEMSCLGQFVEDVALAVRLKAPVHSFLSGSEVPDPADIVTLARGILENKVKAVY